MAGAFDSVRAKTTPRVGVSVLYFGNESVDGDRRQVFGSIGSEICAGRDYSATSPNAGVFGSRSWIAMYAVERGGASGSFHLGGGSERTLFAPNVGQVVGFAPGRGRLWKRKCFSFFGGSKRVDFTRAAVQACGAAG